MRNRAWPRRGYLEMLGRAPFQKKPRIGPIACGLAHVRAERLNPTTVASTLRHALIAPRIGFETGTDRGRRVRHRPRRASIRQGSTPACGRISMTLRATSRYPRFPRAPKGGAVWTVTANVEIED